MELAKVAGTVVSTHKAADMDGLRLLLVEKIDPKTMKGGGSYAVALDAVGANAGELVLYVTGSSARYTEESRGKPADTTIIAIVDSVEVEGKQTYSSAGESP